MKPKVEIDEALAAKVESFAKARGMSVREFVCNTLQQAVNTASPCVPTRFSQRVHDFGAHIESPWTVLADLESEEYVLRYSKK